MSTTAIVIIILVAALVAAAAVIVYMQNRSKRLQERFGPEYTRAIEETGSKRRAEAKLERVEKRVEHYAIHPLDPADSRRFQQSWQLVQAKFVDDPGGALADADELVGQVMTARGYPVAEFDQRAEEISVDHPFVVKRYRAGHEIAVRHQQGKADTEELRQAMIHYRALFGDLVGEPEMARSTSAGSQ